MDDTRNQVIERLKQANNILVTVRKDPTIDLLSACIALALALDKMDKHAAAVFSGAVPSAMEFLKPEDTLERTPDSLRDFIIALDKAKADKLRYKVEDTVVRIFITPYKTSLSEKDLEFSQGDFNVDAVVAIGAHQQEDLDQAIVAHGRILHDATIISINNSPNGNLGLLNWQDIGASSLSEMVSKLVKELGSDILDSQIATALLTGIVAETARFSNDKTTPETMSVAGELMAAGANQQLVATSLQSSQPAVASAAPAQPANDAPANESHDDDGTLDIDHAQDEEPAKPTPTEQPEAITTEQPDKPDEPDEAEETEEAEAEPDEHEPHELPHIKKVHGAPLPEVPYTSEYSDEVPPAVRSYLIDDTKAPEEQPKSEAKPAEPSDANPFDFPSHESTKESEERVQPTATTDNPQKPFTFPSPTSLPPVQQPESVISPMQVPPPTAAPLAQPSTFQPLPQPVMPTTPFQPQVQASDQPSGDADQENETLEEIEKSVHSKHVKDAIDLDAVRNQVANALQQGANPPMEPLKSLNANPLGDELHSHNAPKPPAEQPPSSPSASSVPIEVDADGNLKVISATENAPVAAQPASAMAPPMQLPGTPPAQFPPEPPMNSAPGQMAPPPGPPPIMPSGFGTPAK